MVCKLGCVEVKGFQSATSESLCFVPLNSRVILGGRTVILDLRKMSMIKSMLHICLTVNAIEEILVDPADGFAQGNISFFSRLFLLKKEFLKDYSQYSA